MKKRSPINRGVPLPTIDNVSRLAVASALSNVAYACAWGCVFVTFAFACRATEHRLIHIVWRSISKTRPCNLFFAGFNTRAFHRYFIESMIILSDQSFSALTRDIIATATDSCRPWTFPRMRVPNEKWSHFSSEAYPVTLRREKWHLPVAVRNSRALRRRRRTRNATPTRHTTENAIVCKWPRGSLRRELAVANGAVRRALNLHKRPEVVHFWQSTS